MKKVFMGERSKERGSMLIIAMIIACIMGILTASMLSFQLNNYRQNIKSLYRTKALYLAEAGLQRALRELNTSVDQWDGWSADGTIYSLNISDIGNISITVDTTDPSVVEIIASGTENNITRTVRATAQSSGGSGPLWPGAISALSDLELKSSTLIDSYKNGDTTVAYCNGNIAINGDIDMKNNSAVDGDVRYYDGSCTLFPGAAIQSYDNEEETIIINDYHEALVDPVTLPAITVPTDLSDLAGIATFIDGGSHGSGVYAMDGTMIDNDLTFSGGDIKIDGDLTMKNSKQLYVEGDTRIYITGSFDLKNDAYVNNTSMVDGVEVVHNVEIYCDGDMVFRQGNISNPDSNNDPSLFAIYGTGTGSGTIDVKMGARWSAVVYAPDYEVKIHHAGQIYGAFSAGTVTPFSAFNLHYDERLGESGGGGASANYTVSGWNEV